MESANQFQILNQAFCIKLHADTFEKGMKLSILPQTMGK